MSVNTTRTRTLIAAVATAVLAVGGLTACGTDDEPTKESKPSSSSEEKTGGETKDGDKKGEEKSDESGAYAAGDTAVYDSGLKITVSAAEGYTPDEYAVGHTEGNTAHKVTVTLENTGDENVSADLITVSARAGEDGVDAEEIFDNTVGSGFSGELLPGKKATAVYAFDAPADAKVLDLEVELIDFTTAPAQWSLQL
ncbi:MULTISPECIES: DUF4352 domain-containing protein [unclassified Streptomyces]|uniref:DUF4352 domain-containing protein n=1 Tax=unclassified Streptomyces TaxID=2593676 RepID=UPI0022B6CAEE|nr:MULTISPECIES: DUF4352 domain-containing protein [unclassified Streptomyces]MCZ7414704.1 DUF4352 domain-containing protein [Streptomyces sp. WMMC897]MCZ7431633.1 DUF4352 domain-containing protein [Streptomyces sp. WMMC1477]